MPSTASLLLAVIAMSVLASAAPTSPANVLLEARRPHVAGDLQCPGSDCSIYTGPGGGQFRIKCARDSSENAYYKLVNTANFADCIQKCGADSKCKRVSFKGDVDSSGPCYLKSQVGNGIVVADGVKLATKLQYAANPCT